MTLWLNRLSISVGVTGRGESDTSKFGFYYWSFFPHFHWNGGRFFRREVVDIGWYWLCVHGNVTWWGVGAGHWFWNELKPKEE